MLEVCSGVTNEKEKDGGYKRFDRLRLEGSRSELGGPTVGERWCRSSESELEEVDLLWLEGAHPLL